MEYSFKNHGLEFLENIYVSEFVSLACYIKDLG